MLGVDTLLEVGLTRLNGHRTWSGSDCLGLFQRSGGVEVGLLLGCLTLSSQFDDVRVGWWFDDVRVGWLLNRLTMFSRLDWLGLRLGLSRRSRRSCCVAAARLACTLA